MTQNEIQAAMGLIAILVMSLSLLFWASWDSKKDKDYNEEKNINSRQKSSKTTIFMRIF